MASIALALFTHLDLVLETNLRGVVLLGVLNAQLVQLVLVVLYAPQQMFEILELFGTPRAHCAVPLAALVGEQLRALLLVGALHFVQLLAHSLPDLPTIKSSFWNTEIKWNALLFSNKCLPDFLLHALHLQVDVFAVLLDVLHVELILVLQLVLQVCNHLVLLIDQSVARELVLSQALQVSIKA